ncbi:MAG: integrin alpha [candidate division WOR-3 bacterium]
MAGISSLFKRCFFGLFFVLAFLTAFSPQDNIENINGIGAEYEGWFNKVISDIKASEYEIRWQERYGEYQSPNRAQNLRFSYYSDGFKVKPREDGDKWVVQISLKGYGRKEIKKYIGDRLVVEKNRGYVRGNGIDISFENNEEGMREDFIVYDRPKGKGELILEFDVQMDRVQMGVNDRGMSFVMDVSGGAEVLNYGDMKITDKEGKEIRGEFRLISESGFAIVVYDKDAVYPIVIDPLSLTPNWTGESNQGGAYYGYSVSTAGDVNGDGYSDVIIGAPYYVYNQTDEGRAFVYHGSSTGLSTTPNWTGESNQAGANYGHSVSTAGDVDGDGYSDVIIGAINYDNGSTDEGGVFVYHGNENLSKVVRLRQMRTNLSTLIVPPLLTHSQNSFGVSANLLSSYGRVIGRAQIEVKTINTPFNGLGLTESNWINLGTGGYQFSQIVSGLTNNTLYKWRLRVKYHPKYGKIIHSRWYYIAGNAPNEADFRTGILTGVEQEKDTDRRSGYGLRYRIVKGGVTFEVDGIKEGRIIIYNSLGAFVDQLNIKQDKEIIWAKSVPQGVYFARIEANDGEIDDTGTKFVIIR